jgi:hypothetical protein
VVDLGRVVDVAHDVEPGDRADEDLAQADEGGGQHSGQGGCDRGGSHRGSVPAREAR